ncbi:MAG: hypothetical protein ACLVCH_00065 [Roseburia inulinivorans]
MSQLSEKELSVLNDLLTEEDLLIKNSRCCRTHRGSGNQCKIYGDFPETSGTF